MAASEEPPLSAAEIAGELAPGPLDPGDLAELLADAADSAAGLAHVLVARGILGAAEAAAALGRLHGLATVRPAEERVHGAVVRAIHPTAARTEGWLPLRREGDEVVVCTTRPPDAALLARVAQLFPRTRPRFALTSESDLFDGIMRHLGDALVDEAAHGLQRRQPELSAATTLTARQVLAGLVVLGLVGLLALAWPAGTVAVIVTGTTVAYTANIIFRFLVSLAGARYEGHESVTADELASLSSDELPTYTLLVPAFRESRVIGELVANLARLDYPPEKLDILLLLEQDDPETIAAARAAPLTPPMRLLVVPRAQPRTKPKACNVGLAMARGDLVVIYDAEDRPEPDQLRKAAVLFRRSGERLVCVQAELNFWNAHENVLTRLFTLEYSYWFDYMLQGLSHSRLPIPLGGTSNHFRTSSLRRLGGWDPHNVTEDADLGIRAAALGFQVRTLQSTTWEEACCRPRAWVRQRSRWIKGYMQTTLVHLRHPVRLLRGAGPVQALGFALLVGGTPITFLVAPVLWLVFLASLALRVASLGSDLLPSWLTTVALIDLVVGNAAMIYLSMMGGFRRRRYTLVSWAVLNPVYWLLHSAAAYRALWQLVVRPHHWEKTEHGVARRVTVAS